MNNCPSKIPHCLLSSSFYSVASDALNDLDAKQISIGDLEPRAPYNISTQRSLKVIREWVDRDWGPSMLASES